MAWVLGSVSVGHVSPEPFVAVTESLRLFEVVTLMRPSPGVAMQAIYSISAMDFYGVPRSECAVPDSGLQADTDMPLENLEVNLLYGPRADRESVFLPIVEERGMDTFDPTRTWAEAWAESTATAMLTGRYSQPRPGPEDMIPRGWTT